MECGKIRRKVKFNYIVVCLRKEENSKKEDTMGSQ